ncbi:MAG TPA: hypothetical protein VKI65_14920 [Gemmataceae bacterium]|nr:hypothetical protein [Gemmataceae bacterium]
MRRLIPMAALGCVVAVTLALRADDKKDDAKAAAKKEPAGKFEYIDIQAKANSKLKDDFHGTQFPGNNLGSLPTGEQTFADVKFKIGEKFLQLGSTNLQDMPDKLEGIEVNKKAAKLHFLHATGWFADDETVIGEYVVNWDDGTSVTIPIAYGKDVRDWWYGDDDPEPTQGKVAWKGENEGATSNMKKIRLYLTTWENAKPDKKIKSIDFTTSKETGCAPFCVAITAEEKKQ